MVNQSKNNEQQLLQKQFELNALLEVTIAINNNLPEESLYKIYQFTLLSNLRVKKLALIVKSEEWNIKTIFGVKNEYKNVVFEENEWKDQTEIVNKNEEVPFYEFDHCIKVMHKNNSLAYIFIGNENESEIIDYSFIQTLTNILLVAIENKRMARKELQQEALKKEMEIAREVQSLLFPKVLPSGNPIDMKVTYLPHQSVGGDYYDYIPLSEDRALVCIADVSGKGMPAALLMSNFQASLRTLARHYLSLEDIVSELNFQIKENATGGNFITFFVACFYFKENKFEYINAGHNPPLCVLNSSEISELNIGTIVLGAFSKLPFIEKGVVSYGTKKLMLFAYTDGVTETMNGNDDEYGLDAIKEFILENKGEVNHQKLIDSLDDFRMERHFTDDVTFFTASI